MQLTKLDSFLLTGSESGCLAIICAQTGKTQQRVANAHQAKITTIALNSSGTFIATGTQSVEASLEIIARTLPSFAGHGLDVFRLSVSLRVMCSFDS